MDCWDRFFFDYPEMEPPGREEAVKRALQRSQEKKEARECRKPVGEGERVDGGAITDPSAPAD